MAQQRRSRAKPDRPGMVFDPMLQHERTALAWERTAIATVVTGLLLTQHAATVHWSIAVIGIAQVASGAAVLIWTGKHYDDLHGVLRSGVSPVHPTAARIVGYTTMLFTASATIIAITAALL